MNDSPQSPYSLAWRLALTAVVVRLAYAAIVQTYTLIGVPQFAHMRETFTEPQFLAPMLAHIFAAVAIAGLTTWGAMHRWLARNHATAVDEPRKLFGTFIALQLLYTLAVAAGMAFLQSIGLQFIMENPDTLAAWFNVGMVGRFIALSFIIRVLTIALEIIGICIIVRIAAWTVQPAGQSGGPAYGRRHAAWIAALTMLIWQLNVSIALGAYLQMQSLKAGWMEFALGYLALPAILLAMCALVCLNILPRQIGTARLGRAVAHGTLAFWLAQALGVGLGYLIVRAMTWDQLIRAAQSSWTAVAMLLAYGALLALGCLIARRALYRP
ncbi:hypothetical protein [Achromobacter pestifer]